MGTTAEPWALDNETPSAHARLVRSASTTPVTNAAYLEFIADGGYRTDAEWAPGLGDGPRTRPGGALFWRGAGGASGCAGASG
ncbi:hypothetical protein [Streptomyces sp. KL116D]|uniref:hypothetical protein n=1 Tax=Streptomyces sp. KL116D TaxID=3045152 RepID=UPI0035567CF2